MPPTNPRDRYSSDSANFATEQERTQNDNENSFRGLLLGLLLALLFGGGITALFLFNKKEEVPASVVSPIVVPSVTPSPQPTTKETTIIHENTRELVPVPQATSTQPNINITVPDSKPSVNQPPKSEAPSSDKTTPPAASSTTPQKNATPDQSQSPPVQ